MQVIIPEEYRKHQPQDVGDLPLPTPIARRDMPFLEPTGGLMAARTIASDLSAEAVMWRTKLGTGTVRARIRLEIWDVGDPDEHIPRGWRVMRFADAIPFSCRAVGTVWQIWTANRRLVQKWGRRQKRVR